jgi:hypothetical protein
LIVLPDGHSATVRFDSEPRTDEVYVRRPLNCRRPLTLRLSVVSPDTRAFDFVCLLDRSDTLLVDPLEIANVAVLPNSPAA